MNPMRKVLLGFSLLFAPVVFAATADVQISFFSLSTQPAATGDRFAITMRWRNNGPDTATIVNAIVTGTPGPTYVFGVGTSGWPCYTTAGAASFTCQGAQLAAGGEAEMVLNIIAPANANATNGLFTIRGEVRAAEHDPNLANNSQTATAQLTRAATASDLSLSPTMQSIQAAAGETLRIPFVISNSGNADARNLIAIFTLPVTNNVPVFTAAGEGWSCGHGAFGPQLVICTGGRLNAGLPAPITVTLTAPNTDQTFDLTAHVRAENLHEDVTANNTSVASIRVGAEPQPPVVLQRILVPLTAVDLPGNNNALWRTQTTVMLASDTNVDVRPHSCSELAPTLCIDPLLPLNRPFDISVIPTYRWGGSPNGQFFYVPAADYGKFRANSRVFDAARLEATAGAEIPLAREHDFVDRTLSMLGIPVAPQFRHTLRVYGFDAQEEQVQISLFVGEETVPRVVQVHTLAKQPGSTTFAGGLPTHPSFHQLQLDQMMPLTGITAPLRVDVKPLGAGRIWSFISVTNNNTHHVTTFSAQ
jgi:hypothetical protein